MFLEWLSDLRLLISNRLLAIWGINQIQSHSDSGRSGRGCMMADQEDEMGLGLPPELLAKIFAFLPEQDKLKAAQTCGLWREVCLLPQLWREASLSITGLCDNSQIKQRQMWMKTFGPHMQHLTIWLNLRDEKMGSVDIHHYCERISHECRELFKTITSRLLSIKCHNLWKLYMHGDRRNQFIFYYKNSQNFFTVKQIFRALARLLWRQECLTVVIFTHSYNSTRDNYKLILRALAKPSTASHLKTLIFRSFYDGLGEWTVFSELMGKFPALETLGLSYSYMNDTIMHQITSGSPSLKRLLLYMYSGDVLPNLPPTPDWQMALQRASKLRVGINISLFECTSGEVISVNVDIATVSLPELPVRSLCLDPYDGTRVFMDVNIANAILSVTSNIRGNRQLWALEAFLLKLPRSANTWWQRSEELAAFVKAFPSLTLLCLQMEVTMDVVLKVAAAARPPAEKGEEDGGSSAPCSTPLATPKLQIHVTDCDRALQEIQERLSVVSPLTVVRICRGCQLTAA